MNLPKSTLEITHQYIESILQSGDIAIDATMGNGNDTLFMAKLVGDTGKVYAFDVQPQAVEKTTILLEQHKLLHRTELICDGHQHIAQYLQVPVKAVMFNLGYLPGGDHQIATKGDTTIAALEAAMERLQPGGIISLAIYYGGDSGFDEKNILDQYIQSIDFKQFTVLMHDYVNRPNCSPIAVMIEKNKL